jgi:putative ABC transport system permease protein
VNLAFKEVRRHPGRFAGTSIGMALLFTVVLAMAGIYEGLVDDATVLVRSVQADLWVVQKGTRGPFADISRLDPSVEARVASVPGVRHARSFTHQVLERTHGARSLRSLRFALVGVGWPDDRGTALPLVAGRALAQSHGELIADASLGLPIGAALALGDEEYRIVGLTRQFLASSGDAVLVATRADAQLIVDSLPGDAVRTERERRAERLRKTDLGRTQPSLEDVATDPRWRPPALPSSAIAAVLVEVDSDAQLADVRRAIDGWPDVSVYTTKEEQQLLLDGVVEKPRKQLALFSLILVLTSSVLIAAAIYMMTLQKTHDIAVLKLVGASRARIASMVLQQAWLIGAVGYAIALAIGSQAFPHFPRRVLLTTPSIVGVALLVLVVSTLASLLGVAYALRVDAGRALEA